MTPVTPAGTSALTPDEGAARVASLLDLEESGDRKGETKPPKKPKAPEPKETEESAEPEEGETETEEPEEEGAEGEEGETEEGETEEDAEDPEAEEGEEGEETEDEPEIDPKSMHKVKADGKDVEVTYDELVKGYSRHADYTAKTTALANERKEFGALKDKEMGELRSTRQQFVDRLGTVQAALEALTPAEPDWNKLRNELPQEQFSQVYTEFKQQQERIQQVAKVKQAATEQANADLAKQATAALDVERGKLVEAIPEWKDAAKMKSGLAELVAFCKDTYHFTDADIASVVDHRHLLLLRNAMKYEKGLKNAPKVGNKIKTALKAAAPGAKGTKKLVKKSAVAKQQAAKSGRMDDAIAAVAALL